MWMVGRNHEFRLNLGGTVEDFQKDNWQDQKDRDVKDVWTGPPILELDAGELDGARSKNACREMFFSVMESWVDFEASSLAWKNRNIPVVEMPRIVKANEPARRDEFVIRALASPNSFEAMCGAVRAPLFSLSFYLHDLLRRPLISSQLKSQAKDLDGPLQHVRDGVTELGPKVAEFLRQLRRQGMPGRGRHEHGEA